MLTLWRNRLYFHKLNFKHLLKIKVIFISESDESFAIENVYRMSNLIFYKVAI